MSKLSGLFLIVAGIGAAAYVMPTSETSTERRLADVVQIATNGSALPKQDTLADNQAARFAAPKLVATGVARTDQAADAQRRPASGSMVLAQAQLKSPLQGVDTPVSVPTRPMIVPANKPVEPPAPVPVIRRNALAKPGDPDARAALARDIQKELKRVGCYEGDISAEWSPAAKRAMKAFTDRVNATLPVEEPDHILLTLVQGQGPNACGRACPTGQSPANDGRCLPTAVLAQATKRPVQQPERAPQVAVVTPPAPVTRAVERPADQWRTTTTRTATAPLASPAPAPRMRPVEPIVTAAAPVWAPAPQRAQEPAPGRMALSGPSDPQVVTGSVPLPGSLSGPYPAPNVAAYAPAGGNPRVDGVPPVSAGRVVPRGGARPNAAPAYRGPGSFAPPPRVVRSAPAPAPVRNWAAAAFARP